jgi:hypothetical protein
VVTHRGRDSKGPTLTHAHAVAAVAEALSVLGLDAAPVDDPHAGYDFLVAGGQRLAVRYALPSAYREQTYTKKSGEVSRYRYKRWTFNFHRHGKIAGRYCDVFVCLLGNGEAKPAAASPVTVFVIPWEAITGLTFCSSIRDGSRRPYRGRYERFVDGWPRLLEIARGEAVAPPFDPPRLELDVQGRLCLAGSSRGAGTQGRPGFPAPEPRKAVSGGSS